MIEMKKYHDEFFRITSELICIANEDGFFIDVNPKWTEVLGYTREELIAKPFIDFIHPLDRVKTLTEFANLQKGQSTFFFQNRYRCKDNTYKRLCWNAELSKDHKLVFAAARVTPRNNQDLEKLIDYLPAQIAYWDIFLNNKYANESFINEYGKTAQQIEDETLDVFLGTEAYAKFKPYIIEVLKGIPQSFESKVKSANGEFKYTLTKLIPDQVAGEMKGFYLFTHDITEIKLSELKLIEYNFRLKKEKNKYKFLVEALDKSAIVATTDVNGKITQVNDKFCAISKYSREELIGKTHKVINSGVHSKEFFKNFWETLYSGKSWHGEICNRKKNGDLYWVDTSVVPMLDDIGKIDHFISIRFDITDRIEAQKINAQNAQMAALGDMANGMAHEINNPLAIIKGKLNLIDQKLKGNTFQTVDPDVIDKLRQDIFKIDHSVQRVAKLIKTLRQFSNKESTDKLELIDLNVIIQSANEFFTERITHNQIKIDVALDGMLYNKKIQLLCQPTQILQVFINLFSNSIDAIKDLPDKWIQIFITLQNNRILIYFSDSGDGIPTNIIDKVMNPFFTTKDVGKGTGLGLSMSKRIIEKHGGQFFIDTKKNNTCFVIQIQSLLEETAKAV